MDADALLGGPIATTVCVARQRIEDGEGRAVGVEVLFRPHAAAQTADHGWDFDDDVATASVMLAVTSEFRPEDVSGDALMFLNLPRSFLVGDAPLPLEPDAVVLEILERVALDDEVLAGVDRLLDAGYTLAMDDVVPDDPRLPYVGRCGFVKVDLHDVPDDELAGLVAAVRVLSPGVLTVAERVETVEEMAVARAAGFDLFQGYLINRPTILVRDSVRTSSPIAARLLVEVLDPTAETGVLAELVLSDPGIARRVLRGVNSAAGVRGEVRDVVQALSLIGRERLQGLLVLELIGAGGHQDREVPLFAVARTRAAQLLVPDEPLVAATESLARMCIAMLGMSSAEVADWLPRPAVSTRAAVACDALDRYLDAVDRGADPCLPVGFTPLEVSFAWLNGLRHARELLAEVPRPRGPVD